MSNSSHTPKQMIITTKDKAWIPEALKPGRVSIVREFALNTSTHGLPGIARSQSKHNCIFWAVSFLFFTGIMIFFVTQSIQSYFEYPTQTSVSINVERSQTFPAVTICNFSPIRYDMFIEPFLNYTNTLNITRGNNATEINVELSSKIYDFIVKAINANQSISDYLFSLDLMLLECIYNDQVCTVDDFTFFFSGPYGRCYTFNAKLKNSDTNNLRKVNDNGALGKLILRLYTHNDLYVPYISGGLCQKQIISKNRKSSFFHLKLGVSAGMVAMIHDNTQLPLIDLAGIELAPGRKHKLSYKKKTIQFLSAPYTQCTTEVPPVMKAMFDQYGAADYAYSQGVCNILCIQAYIYQQCKCVNPYHWTARSIHFPENNIIFKAPLCPIDDKCYANAAQIMIATASIWDQFCSHCTQQCSNVDFTITPSSTSSISVEYAHIFKSKIESVRENNLPKNWSTNWLDEFQKNYVALEVFCQSTEVETYTQEASITGVDVISNVGGHTGLWIGISFLSIMEFIEMLYRLTRYQYHVMKTKINNKIRQRQQINTME